MMPERWQQVYELFIQALPLSREERERLLNVRCSGEPELRAQVEILLENDLRANEEVFLPVPHDPEITNRISLDHLHLPCVHIQCPHCRNPIEIVDLAPTDEVRCPTCGSSFRVDPHASATWSSRLGGKNVGRFALLETIGFGQFGTVYKAHDAQLDRMVALKVLRGANVAWEDERNRFIREARSVAQLHHKAIVPVHEVGSIDGIPFIISDLVRGVTLADWLAARRPGAREAARLVAEVADALQYAHDNGVIHRDVKPSNIMLDEEDHPHLVDFGLAKREAGEITITLDGQVLGTPAYMSPEQARGEGHSVDGRSDLYSLGVVLYELLTGEPPFRGNTRMLLSQVLNEEPKSLRAINDAVPRELDTICLKTLAKEPGRRYGTAREFAQDLRRFLAGEPIHARPTSLFVRLRLWAQRNPRIAGLTVAVFGLLALVAVVATVSSVRVSSALTRERLRLISQYLNTAIRAADEGNVSASIPWFIEAMKRDVRPENDRIHRMRIASVLRRVPRPQRIWSVGSPIVSVALGPDGQTVMTAAGKTARVWRVSSGTAVTPPLEHDAPLLTAALSRDGRRVLTVGGSTARVWDAATGAPVTPSLDHGSPVRSAAFSSDGLLIATGGEDGAVQIWSVASAQPHAQRLLHRDVVNEITFSSDGRLLLTAVGGATKGRIGDAVLWNVSTGLEANPPFRHGDDVYQAAFSPDGNRVVTASYDGMARVWDIATRRSLELPHDHAVTGCAFSPGGRLVVTIRGNEAWIWALEPAPVPKVPPLRHRGPILQAVFSPDGCRVATAGDDHLVRVWDVATGEPVLAPLAHNGRVASIAFSPDGRFLLTGAGDRAARLWDLVCLQAPARSFAHDRTVTSASFSGEGSRVVTSSDDGTAGVWDAATGASICRLVGHRDRVSQASFSGDGKRIATASVDGTAIVWNATTGKPLFPPLKHRAAVTWASFSPDSRRVVTASLDRTARVWDADTGALAATYPHAGEVLVATFDSTGKAFLTASRDGTAHRFVTDGTTRRSVTVRHSFPLRHAEFSPDGSSFVAADDGGYARVWDAATGAAVSPPMAHDGAIAWASFSPDSRWVATASTDRTARIWDARSGLPRTPSMSHDEPVNRAAFSPDGRMIVTGSGGGQRGNVGQARLFDARTGEFVSMPLTHGDSVLAVCFDPSGRFLLTAASRDAAARLWEVAPDNRPIHDLERLGAVLSGTQVDESGGLVIRSSDEISRDHAWIMLRYPSSLAGLPGDLLAWHEDGARSAEAAAAWKAALAHLDSLVIAEPTNSLHLARRGRAHAEVGHWTEAARDYGQAVATGSENRTVWYESQLLQLKVADIAAYRAACSKLLQRFEQTLDMRQANDIAYICVLAPDATPDSERVLTLAIRATRGLPQEELLTLNTLGAAYYRAGHFREAIDMLEKSIQLSADRTGMEGDWTFLAMAYYRQNNVERARRCLANARRLAGLEVAQQTDAASPAASSPRWQDALHSAIILSECESLVAPPR